MILALSHDSGGGRLATLIRPLANRLALIVLAISVPASAYAAETEHGHPETAVNPNPLTIDPDLAIFTAIVFLLLLAILWKFAWGPICEALDRRDQGISDTIAAAETKHQEAKELLGQYEDKLAQAADRVRELLEEARRDAEHTKAEILAEAKAAAQAEHDRSMRDLKNATDGALKQIAESGSRLAIDLAGKIVERELNEKDHDRLIRDAVASFPSEN